MLTSVAYLMPWLRNLKPMLEKKGARVKALLAERAKNNTGQ